MAARISPVPLLIVHGDRDHYFPVEHAEALYAAAREPKELWLVEGFGHAESAATPEPCSTGSVRTLRRWSRAARGR